MTKLVAKQEQLIINKKDRLTGFPLRLLDHARSSNSMSTRLLSGWMPG